MFDDQLGVLASLNYLKGDKSNISFVEALDGDIFTNGKRDTKYMSLLAGPFIQSE